MTARHSAVAQCLLIVLALAIGLLSDPARANDVGANLYAERCAKCHEGGVPRAPHRVFLSRLPGTVVANALDRGGLMAMQGDGLDADQRRQVAIFLTGKDPNIERETPSAPVCSKPVSAAALRSKPSRFGWGHDNSRFIPNSVARLTRDQIPHLSLKWAFAYPNASRARGQPAIAFGAVYTGGQDGHVRALDLDTGCVRWEFTASAEVRTGMVLEGRTVYFGDLIGHAYAVDAITGQLRWKIRVDEHPHATLTGTPAVHDGTLYVPVSSLELLSAIDPKYPCCTFRGSIVALRTRDGHVRWKSYSIPIAPSVTRHNVLGTAVYAPSGAPIWNSPTIDAKRGVLYVGTGESYTAPAAPTSDSVLAMRLSDGKHVWHFQALAGDVFNHGCFEPTRANCPEKIGPDYDIGASVVRLRGIDGKERLFAGQKSGWVFALDPDAKGRLLWKTRVGRGGITGGVHFGMSTDGQRLFVPIHDADHELDLVQHDEPRRPGLFALDPISGATLWAAHIDDVCHGRKGCNPGISAAATTIPGVVFAAHADGVLRAYDTNSGDVLWQFDTTNPVQTTSGALTSGGSMGSGGVAIRDGYVIVNSGYVAPAMPGNVMLVFAPRSRT